MIVRDRKTGRKAKFVLRHKKRFTPRANEAADDVGCLFLSLDCCEGQGSGRKQSVSPSLKCPGNTKAKRLITTLTSFLLIADKSTQKDCIKKSASQVQNVKNMLRKTNATWLLTAFVSFLMIADKGSRKMRNAEKHLQVPILHSPKRFDIMKINYYHKQKHPLWVDLEQMA